MVSLLLRLKQPAFNLQKIVLNSLFRVAHAGAPSRRNLGDNLNKLQFIVQTDSQSFAELQNTF